MSTEVLGWTAPTTLAFLGVALVLLVAFVVWEQRSPHPLLPLRIVLERNRGGSYLVFLFVGAGLFAMLLFLTSSFQITLGYTSLRSGMAFLPFSVGIVVGAGIVAQLLPRLGPEPLLLPGLTMAIVGMLLLIRVEADSSYAGAVTAYLSEKLRDPAQAQAVAGQALVEGYHTAFFCGAVLLGCALLVATAVVNATKQDAPTQGAVGAVA